MQRISLTQGYEALVDDADYEHLRKFSWSVAVRGPRLYVQRAGPGARPILMHQELIPVIPNGKVRHHLNGNGLDNRRANLRVVSQAENTWGFQAKRPGSKSKYRGVSWTKRDSLWTAQITYKGCVHYLGRFEDEEVAARTYDKAASELFGEHAHLNFP